MLVAAADRFDSALVLTATAVTLVYRWSYNRAQLKAEDRRVALSSTGCTPMPHKQMYRGHPAPSLSRL